jgi:hypothetical protein
MIGTHGIPDFKIGQSSGNNASPVKTTNGTVLATGHGKQGTGNDTATGTDVGDAEAGDDGHSWAVQGDIGRQAQGAGQDCSGTKGGTASGSGQKVCRALSPDLRRQKEISSASYVGQPQNSATTSRTGRQTPEATSVPEVRSWTEHARTPEGTFTNLRDGMTVDVAIPESVLERSSTSGSNKAADGQVAGAEVLGIARTPPEEADGAECGTGSGSEEAKRNRRLASHGKFRSLESRLPGGLQPAPRVPATGWSTTGCVRVSGTQAPGKNVPGEKSLLVRKSGAGLSTSQGNTGQHSELRVRSPRAHSQKAARTGVFSGLR